MDTKEWIIPKELLNETDVLCLFGFYGDLIQKSLDSWLLQGDKELFLVEKNRSYVLEDFLKLAQRRVFQKFTYLISPFLEGVEKLEMEDLLLRCQSIEWHTHVESSDYQDLGVQVFQNLYENSLKKVNVKNFSNLKNSLKGIPAFICGAGPSLKEALPFLKQVQNRGVIFAGGAALSSGIPFQIAAGIDPDPCFERCIMQEEFEAPFFFQGRFSNKLLNLVQGPLFQVPSHSGLKIDTSLDTSFNGGCTVTTFCTALALHFGCNPIFFVGMDLAYADEKTKYFQQTSQEGVNSSAVYENLLSQKDWVVAAKWLEHLAATHPETSFYSLSKQGLTLKGISKTSWEDVLRNNQSFFDIKGLIQWIRSQEENAQFSLEQKVEEYEKMQQSLKSCIEKVQDILLMFESAYPEDPTAQGAFILHLFALYDEIVYQQLLEPLWKIWRFPIERNLSTEYSKKIHQWLFFKRVLEVHLQ